MLRVISRIRAWWARRFAVEAKPHVCKPVALGDLVEVTQTGRRIGGCRGLAIGSKGWLTGYPPREGSQYRIKYDASGGMRTGYALGVRHLAPGRSTQDKIQYLLQDMVC